MNSRLFVVHGRYLWTCFHLPRCDVRKCLLVKIYASNWNCACTDNCKILIVLTRTDQYVHITSWDDIAAIHKQ